ncbi:MAG: DUF4440 domain-containing protein [Bacteroidota bacterium]
MGKYHLLLVPLLFTIGLKAQAENNSNITIQSQRFAEALQTEDAEALSTFFNEDSAILPEYHPTLRGVSAILAYYKTLFEGIESQRYAREPFEIKRVGDLYMELGLFTYQYSTPDGKTFDYKGKYTTYWKMEEDTPYIWAFIWGASAYFEKEKVDFVQIITEPQKTILPNSEWENAIEQQRQKAYSAVLNEDLEAQMTSYHHDAIYMTYYDPPFKGKKAIHDYFESHYNPSVKRDSLMTRLTQVAPLGDYALRFGEYYVEWIYEGERSFIEGKGLTLYKRMANDSIKIFRQMINHSMPPTLLKDKDSIEVARILKHLDNQHLPVKDYLVVYDDLKLMVNPPNLQPINGKKAFIAHLEAERENGKVRITHNPIEMKREGDNMHVRGYAEGIFTPSGSDETYPFKTKNQMYLVRDDALKWKIQRLSWQMD